MCACKVGTLGSRGFLVGEVEQRRVEGKVVPGAGVMMTRSFIHLFRGMDIPETYLPLHLPC